MGGIYRFDIFSGVLFCRGGFVGWVGVVQVLV